MAGLSSKALAFGEPGSKKAYVGNEIQNNEFADGSGLELYDFNARTYDQQTGRFIQIDPLSDIGGQERWNPYHYSYNNPSTFSDPSGKIVPFIIAIAAVYLTISNTPYGRYIRSELKNYGSGRHNCTCSVSR